MLILHISILLLICLPLNQSSLCKDNTNGQDIALWFMYKLPSRCKVGHNRFIYFDSNPTQQADETYTLYPARNQRDDTIRISAMEFTLQPLYSAKTEYQWLAYSDQPPKPKRSYTKAAHSKGILAYNETNKAGFWIIHSQPRWPSFESEDYTFNPSELAGPSAIFAQHFLCISFNGDEMLANIKKQLGFIGVHVYDGNFDGKLPGKGAQQPWAMYSSINIFSITNDKKSKGSLINIIAGNDPFSWDVSANDDIEVDPDQKTDTFSWDSWLRGVQKIPESVYNQNLVTGYSVNFKIDGKKSSCSWGMGSTHCKIGYSQMQDIVCVGDLNIYHGGENSRGGLFACVKDSGLKQFLDINVYEEIENIGAIVCTKGLQSKVKEQGEVKQENRGVKRASGVFEATGGGFKSNPARQSIKQKTDQKQEIQKQNQQIQKSCNSRK